MPPAFADLFLKNKKKKLSKILVEFLLGSFCDFTSVDYILQITSGALSRDIFENSFKHAFLGLDQEIHLEITPGIPFEILTWNYFRRTFRNPYEEDFGLIKKILFWINPRIRSRKLFRSIWRIPEKVRKNFWKIQKRNLHSNSARKLGEILEGPKGGFLEIIPGRFPE